MTDKSRAAVPSLWQVSIRAAAARRGAIETLIAEVFGDAVQSLASFEDGTAWTIAALLDAPPDARAWRLLRTGLEGGETLGDPVPVPDRDWVAKVQRDMPAVSAGRFWVHGSHVGAPAPGGAVAVRIDAASAFGTGHHESTLGCLLALDRLGRRSRPGAVLDVGCGSGILAIAAAKLWRVPVLASDNDPEAVRVTRHNAAANGVAHLVRAVHAEGVRHRVIRRRARFDLVTANILAGPLVRLAPALADATHRDGSVVLSGLLHAQQREVSAAYRAAGFALSQSRTSKGWSTLVVRRL